MKEEETDTLWVLWPGEGGGRRASKQPGTTVIVNRCAAVRTAVRAAVRAAA